MALRTLSEVKGFAVPGRLSLEAMTAKSPAERVLGARGRSLEGSLVNIGTAGASRLTDVVRAPALFAPNREAVDLIARARREASTVPLNLLNNRNPLIPPVFALAELVVHAVSAFTTSGANNNAQPLMLASSGVAMTGAGDADPEVWRSESTGGPHSLEGIISQGQKERTAKLLRDLSYALIRAGRKDKLDELLALFGAQKLSDLAELAPSRELFFEAMERLIHQMGVDYGRGEFRLIRTGTLQERTLLQPAVNIAFRIADLNFTIVGGPEPWSD